MPAKSKQQQALFALVKAYKKGEIDPKRLKNKDKIRQMAKDISTKDVDDFAGTKTKGLPKKVKNNK